MNIHAKPHSPHYFYTPALSQMMAKMPQRVARFILLRAPAAGRRAGPKMTFQRLAWHHDLEGLLASFIRAGHPGMPIEEFEIHSLVNALRELKARGRIPDHYLLSSNSTLRLQLSHSVNDAYWGQPQIFVGHDMAMTSTDDEWAQLVKRDAAESVRRVQDGLPPRSWVVERHLAAIDAVRQHLKKQGIEFVERRE